MFCIQVLFWFVFYSLQCYAQVEEWIACPQDVTHCPDGNFVFRDILNDCNFHPCQDIPLIGGDMDENGCIGSAGYTWCVVKNKCLRRWEESCSLDLVGVQSNELEGVGKVMFCTEEIAQCADGSFVSRDPQNNCEFSACPTATMFGSDIDQYGCTASAGYTWCSSASKCLRVWEECPTVIFGSDIDQSGCIASAGYTWCASKNKCLRVWEEECPTVGVAAVPVGGGTDEYGCLSSAGYTWCVSKKECLRAWEEECPAFAIGSDVDQYGCKGSAGYTWCAFKNKCIRTWEEECLRVTIIHNHQPVKRTQEKRARPNGTASLSEHKINVNTPPHESTSETKGNINQYDCKSSDGYTWCASKNKCIPIEEECLVGMEMCRSTSDCTTEKYCTCNPNAPSTTGWQMDFLGVCTPWQQDGQPCSDPTHAGCQQKCAPELVCHTNPLLSDTSGICGTPMDEVYFCLDEVKRCPDGSLVSRDPERNCDFRPCKYVFIGCTEDVKQCPDGTFVSRDPERDCDFSPCKYIFIGCTEDVKQCPGGTVVSRDPQRNCQFHSCRYGGGFTSNWRSSNNIVGPNLGRVSGSSSVIGRLGGSSSAIGRVSGSSSSIGSKRGTFDISTTGATPYKYFFYKPHAIRNPQTHSAGSYWNP